MNRSIWTKLGIIELGALAVLWRNVSAAPLVAFERDLDDCALDDGADRSSRRFRRSVDRDQRRAG